MEASTSVRVKRAKHSTACDLCRRRKVACDASEMPDKRCSRCASSGVECLYNPTTGRRSGESYVEALEERLKNMEDLIDKLSSNSQRQEDGDSESDRSRRHVSEDSPVFPPTPPQSAPPTFRVPPLQKLTGLDSDDLGPSDDDDDDTTLNSVSGYHGKSSNKELVLAVLDHKRSGSRRTWFTKPPGSLVKPRLLPVPMFVNETSPHIDFPPADLMSKLVDAYFEQLNLYLPLLHRPSFEEDIRKKLHLRDRRFGTVVLLVCAIGAPWTTDGRLVKPTIGRAPGQEYFDQVLGEQWNILARPHLRDVQACALSAAYLNLTGLPFGHWTLTTLGLRMAQDVGAHRKKMYSAVPTIEQELWKRAFWVLVALDRLCSCGMGRPCAINDEDFDVEPMTECDDAYWTNADPAQAFVQPPGQPSRIAFANTFLRLTTILAFALRTIYTINKSKLLLGFFGAEWKQNIVTELDSALNKWSDSVPSHLRWDPDRENMTWFRQSSVLYCVYNQVRTAVHRQFLPTLRHPTPELPLPSLTLCTTAARSIINIMEVQYKRTGTLSYPLAPHHAHLFSSCTILLVGVWGGRLSEREQKALMADVDRCMKLFKMIEKDDPDARKSVAILTALIKLPSASGSEDSGTIVPRDVGDLILLALESMRISAEEDETSATEGTSSAQRDSAHPPSLSGTTPEYQESSTGSVSTLVDPVHEDPRSKITGYPPWQFMQDPYAQHVDGVKDGKPSPSRFGLREKSPLAMDIGSFAPPTLAADDFALGYEDFLDSISGFMSGMDYQGPQPIIPSPPPPQDIPNAIAGTMDPVLVRYLFGEAGDPSGTWTGPTSRVVQNTESPTWTEWRNYMRDEFE